MEEKRTGKGIIIYNWCKDQITIGKIYPIYIKNGKDGIYDDIGWFLPMNFLNIFAQYEECVLENDI